MHLPMTNPGVLHHSVHARPFISYEGRSHMQGTFGRAPDRPDFLRSEPQDMGGLGGMRGINPIVQSFHFPAELYAQ